MDLPTSLDLMVPLTTITLTQRLSLRRDEIEFEKQNLETPTPVF
jgi:hypothetical protein